jgi:hypothetical protein
MTPARPARRAWLVLGGLLALVFGTIGARAWLDARRTGQELEALRARMGEVRSDADACRRALARQEDAFRSFDRAVDSLAAEVRRLEALDPRGVPRDVYPGYLELFDAYNDSVAAWPGRADALRDLEERCRTSIEVHNALADSLRRRLETEGIEGV